jgi:uncharacterized protein (TIGR00299 family) protein
MHIHLDPMGGCSGDMFLAALLDAWPEHIDGLLAAVRTLPLPESIGVRVVEHRDHVFAGSRFVVEDRGEDEHDHVHFAAVRDRLAAAGLEDGVHRRALAVFTHLAEAEGRVHGVAVDDVTFHEVGAWDSIVDIVGAAWLIEALAATRWSVAPLPVGSGRIESSHGPLPVPAPATALLLADRVVFDDGIPGERVTPTGAALLRHLDPRPGLDAVPRRLVRSGFGFGARTLPDISNVLRVLAFDAEEEGASTRADPPVAELRFEVDDQSPEDLAVGLDRLRAVGGVGDVLQAPVFGKKGRLAVQVQVLVRRHGLDELVDACFRETTTLGLRWYLPQRVVLRRRTTEWVDDDRTIEVKHAARPGGPTAKAAVGDVADIAGSADRTRLRRRAEDAVSESVP